MWAPLCSKDLQYIANCRNWLGHEEFSLRFANRGRAAQQSFVDQLAALLLTASLVPPERHTIANKVLRNQLSSATVLPVPRFNGIRWAAQLENSSWVLGLSFDLDKNVARVDCGYPVLLYELAEEPLKSMIFARNRNHGFLEKSAFTTFCENFVSAAEFGTYLLSDVVTDEPMSPGTPDTAVLSDEDKDDLSPLLDFLRDDDDNDNDNESEEILEAAADARNHPETELELLHKQVELQKAAIADLTGQLAGLDQIKQTVSALIQEVRKLRTGREVKRKSGVTRKRSQRIKRKRVVKTL